MNSKEFDKLLKDTQASTIELLIKKGHEYAGDNEDRLINFKSVAADCGVHPLQAWLVFANKHWRSIVQYIKDTSAKKEIQSIEPIEGRIDDLINYLLLCKGLIIDSKSPTAKTTVKVDESESLVERPWRP